MNLACPQLLFTKDVGGGSGRVRVGRTCRPVPTLTSVASDAFAWECERERDLMTSCTELLIRAREPPECGQSAVDESAWLRDGAVAHVRACMRHVARVAIATTD